MPREVRRRPELGVRAQIVMMAAVVRSLFVRPSSAPAPNLLNTNDHRKPSRTNGVRRWSFRMLRAVNVLVIVMRFVVAMTAVQITGIPHVMADVVAAVQSDEDHETGHENCPNDDDGRQCPPGCPSCHCTHAMSALPAVPVAMVLEPLVPIEIAVAPYEAQGPPNPEPMTPYRPPRTTLA